MVELNFDASGIDPTDNFGVIPAGTYLVHIVQSEMRQSKSGSGQYLWLELDILDGPYKGRKLWPMINLRNANPDVAARAQRELAAICHAVGVMRAADSEMLHFKPLQVKVRVRPAGPDKHGVHRDEQNEIRGYEKAGARPAPSGAMGGVIADAAAAQAASKPGGGLGLNGPWKQG